MSIRLRITRGFSGKSGEIAAFARDELAQWAEVGRSEHVRAQSLCVAYNCFETRLQLSQPLYRSIETSAFMFHASHLQREVARHVPMGTQRFTETRWI